MAGGPPNLALVFTIGAWVALTSGVSGVTKGQSLGKLIAGTRAVRDGGGQVGFWWSFLRDTVCRLLYCIPLVGLADNLWPVGSTRESLRDKMTATHVLQTEAYPRRVQALTVAMVLSIGACWGSIEATISHCERSPCQ